MLFGGVLPGGGLIRKNVVSIRERRYLNLVRQQTDYSCGAAALATILKYGYEIDTNEQGVLQGLLKVADATQAQTKGFSMLDMKRYVKTIGLRGRGYRVPENQLERVRIPVIALLNLKGYNHFVVFKKAQDGQVYLADPALGNKVVDREEFVAGWNGFVFAVIRNDFDRNSVLLDPAEPLKANKMQAFNQAIQKVWVENGNAQITRHLPCDVCF